MMACACNRRGHTCVACKTHPFEEWLIDVRDLRQVSVDRFTRGLLAPLVGPCIGARWCAPSKVSSACGKAWRRVDSAGVAIR